MSERRADQRVPVELQMVQYIDNSPIPSVVSNLSLSGLHASHAIKPMSRSCRLIQLELTLSGCPDSLWAKGEIVYDFIGPMYHGTGIRFVAMAHHHRELLGEWIRREVVTA